jgi:hypothetical protein
MSRAETTTCLAWIGHKSYIDNPNPSLAHMIFDTKVEAQRAGWKNPSRVRVTLIQRKP